MARPEGSGRVNFALFLPQDSIMHIDMRIWLDTQAIGTARLGKYQSLTHFLPHPLKVGRFARPTMATVDVKQEFRIETSAFAKRPGLAGQIR
jgi:hypothetical protein